MTLNAACKGPELISDDEELYFQYLIVSQFKTERRCQYLVDSAVTGAFFKTLPDCCIFAKVVCDGPTYAYIKLFSLLKLFVMFQYMFTSRYDITQPHVLYKCTCKWRHYENMKGDNSSNLNVQVLLYHWYFHYIVYFQNWYFYCLHLEKSQYLFRKA